MVLIFFKGFFAGLIFGRKFTVFALFYFVFEGKFQVQASRDLYSEGQFNGGFFALQGWGGGLFSEFYGMCKNAPETKLLIKENSNFGRKWDKFQIKVQKSSY